MLHRLGMALVVCLFTVCSVSTAGAQFNEAHRQQVNQGTVGVITGGVDGTYIRIASDLASVLDDGDTIDDGDSVRVLPVIGRGSVQNIADILYLRGIDIGIVQSDVLTFVRRQNLHPDLDRRIAYITKLYNEEVQILAGRGIERLEDLAGREVNIGLGGSGTAMTASLVFDTLNIPIVPVHYDEPLALEKVRTGEIAALMFVAGKPTRLFRDLTPEDGVHFLAVPYTPELLETYLPSRLTTDDYPQLIPSGQEVDTVAVGAVMAVYNWAPKTERYEKVARFVDAFFSHFGEFQQPPRHAKWREVNLNATVPGWTRFTAAEEWLREHAAAGAVAEAAPASLPRPAKATAAEVASPAAYPHR